MIRSRFAIIFCLCVQLLVLLDRALVHFAYERGRGQDWLVYCNGMADLLMRPGKLAAEFLRLTTPERQTVLGTVVMFGVSLPFHFLLGLWVGRWWRWWRSAGKTAPGAATTAGYQKPERVSRRSMLRAAGRSVVVAGATVGAYSFFIEPFRPRILRRTISIKGLPRELDGLTIAHLTDIHHGPWLPISGVRGVVEMTNALQPDLIALTGDFVHHSPAYIAPAAEALAGLRAKVGVLAVMGNHDWREDGMLLRREFGRRGLPLIDNTRVFLSTSRKLTDAEGGLCIAGVGDLWTHSQDYDAALGGVAPEVPRLLLSHNPDVAEEPPLLQRGYRVDLMLSGHTHGGQIWVPGMGTPVIPSRFGQKYAHGLNRGPAFDVWTSAGIGMAVLPLRLAVPPEVVVLELRAGRF